VATDGRAEQRHGREGRGRWVGQNAPREVRRSGQCALDQGWVLLDSLFLLLLLGWDEL